MLISQIKIYSYTHKKIEIYTYAIGLTNTFTYSNIHQIKCWIYFTIEQGNKKKTDVQRTYLLNNSTLYSISFSAIPKICTNIRSSNKVSQNIKQAQVDILAALASFHKILSFLAGGYRKNHIYNFNKFGTNKH